MRTLIVSDFHLGNRLGHDVLTRPAPLARLLDALDGVERLVLLGDTVELRNGRPEASMARAEPVLRRIGERLSAQTEVILVAGNHDLPLVRPFIRDDPGRLTVATRVPADTTTRLSRLVRWLGGPQRVEVRYPGVWLGEDVYAIHGHYLDRHLIPASAVGISRGVFGELPNGSATPATYERTPRRAERRHATAEDELDTLRAWLLPRLRQRLVGRRAAPVISRVLDLQMRRAAIPGLGHVAARLGVRASWLVFGHVHRTGPLAGDDPAQWRAGVEGPGVVNTGAWLLEPTLARGARPPHGYWPGGAVMLEPGAPPRAVGLLDDLTEADLRRRRYREP